MNISHYLSKAEQESKFIIEGKNYSHLSRPPLYPYITNEILVASFSFFFFFFFWGGCTPLDLQNLTSDKTNAPGVEAWSTNHWTARGFLYLSSEGKVFSDLLVHILVRKGGEDYWSSLLAEFWENEDERREII